MNIAYILNIWLISLYIDLNMSLNSKDKSAKGNGYGHECLRSCEYPPKPRTCNYVFVIEWTNTMSAECFDCPFNKSDCFLDRCISVDGSIPRGIIVTNGKMPGPSIEVCQWDTIRVKVINRLQDHAGLAIHWHGMYQKNNNWMDGASMITQCPIVPGSSFVYKFVADPPGTHWWHGHSGFQRSDGLYGALIVRKPKEVNDVRDAYDVDLSEHILQVTDYRNPAGLFITLQLTSASNYVSSDVLPFPLLVNGRAMGEAFFDENLNQFYTPGTTFEITEGLRYRFRIISSAYGFCVMHMFIEGHTMEIISLDGSDIKPKRADSILIGSGESVDIVLTANAKGSSYCWYFMGNENSVCSGNGTILLLYKDRMEYNEIKTCNPKLVPTENLSETGLFKLMEAQSMDPIDPDFYRVDAKFYFKLSLLVESRESTFFIHNQIDYVSFIYPPSPLLSPSGNRINQTMCEPNKYPSGYAHCSTELCKCTPIVKVGIGEVVEFILIGDGTELTHTMHMHGHDFRVLAQAIMPANSISLTTDDFKTYDEQGKLSRLPLEEATVKDTVNVPTNGYAIIRWKADNPGYWFFHCHSESHLETGMALIIQVGDHEEIPLPPSNFPTCGPWMPEY